MTDLPDPYVEDVPCGDRAISVVRDDLVPGGTKRRVLPLLLTEGREFVYASPAEGFAQVALAHAARDCGKRSRVFVARRRELHRNTILAANAGAEISQVHPGYMAVLRKRARDYCFERPEAKLLPFGLDDARIIEAIAAIAHEALDSFRPREIWITAGSGVMTRAMQRAFPHAKHYAVQVGRKLAHSEAGHATVITAPERFAQDAKAPPPFPSCLNYDAKAWQFIERLASDRAIFWNVA